MLHICQRMICRADFACFRKTDGVGFIAVVCQNHPEFGIVCAFVIKAIPLQVAIGRTLDFRDLYIDGACVHGPEEENEYAKQ